MLFEKALSHIARLEHPQPDYVDDVSYHVALKQCVASKFRSAYNPIS